MTEQSSILTSLEGWGKILRPAFLPVSPSQSRRRKLAESAGHNLHRGIVARLIQLSLALDELLFGRFKVNERFLHTLFRILRVG